MRRWPKVIYDQNRIREIIGSVKNRAGNRRGRIGEPYVRCC
jgi:hypothetical protein